MNRDSIFLINQLIYFNETFLLEYFLVKNFIFYIFGNISIIGINRDSTFQRF